MTSDGSGARTARGLIEHWSQQTPRAVLFDFNGTLSDDEGVLFAVFAEIFAERYSWSMGEQHYREHLLGMSDREIIDQVRREQGDGDRDAVAAMLTQRRERYLERVRSEPTITSTARDLVHGLQAAGAQVGIVTGAQRDEVRHVLALCGLEGVFDVVLTEEDVEHGKPDPEGYLAAAARLAVAPQGCLAFEDSSVGVRSAAAACMCVVVVGGGDAPLPEGASARVESLRADLLPGAR